MLDFLRGSVRPILTLIGFCVASWLTLAGKLDAQLYWTTVGMMLAFWFGERKKSTG